MEKIKEKLVRMKEEGKFLRHEIQHQTLTYIVAALGLIVGLAWNDAVRSLIEYFFPLSQKSLAAKFIYATIITIAFVFFSIYLMKLFGKKNDKN